MVPSLNEPAEKEKKTLKQEVPEALSIQSERTCKPSSGSNPKFLIGETACSFVLGECLRLSLASHIVSFDCP